MITEIRELLTAKIPLLVLEMAYFKVINEKSFLQTDIAACCVLAGLSCAGHHADLSVGQRQTSGSFDQPSIDVRLFEQCKLAHPEIAFLLLCALLQSSQTFKQQKGSNKVHCPAYSGASFDHDVVPGNGHLLSKSGDL
jgi:hypothetical protein